MSLAGQPAAAAAKARRARTARVLAPSALGVMLAWSGVSHAAAQGFQHDSQLPIEITSDSLEVLQDQQIATFIGNVDAVQGNLLLTSDELRVYYRGSGAEAGMNAGSIRRIEAEGNVVMTSPEEIAEGEFGVYDVDGALLTLEGSVVLTRDENIVRGQRLEIDLVTGRSQMFSAMPSTAGGSSGERVRAIFVPPPPEPAAGPSGDAGSNGEAAPNAVEPSPPKATQ